MLTLLLLGNPFERVEIFFKIVHDGLVSRLYKSIMNSFRTIGKSEKQDFKVF